LKKIFKTSGFVILSLILFVGLYLGMAFALSRIAVEKETENAEDLSIYIITNGVHTDLVLPVKSTYIDWSRDIKFQHTASKDSLMDFVAFGWGDKGFYLETPTWADLRFSVAFKAATNLSTSAIHATYYKRLSEGEHCKRIPLSNDQYIRLVNYIKSSLQTDEKGQAINIVTASSYGRNDAFYEAKGRYNLFYTCNTWANNALKSSGLKACFWTPFDTGIFYQYK